MLDRRTPRRYIALPTTGDAMPQLWLVVLLSALVAETAAAQDELPLRRQGKGEAHLATTGPWQPLQHVILMRLEQSTERGNGLSQRAPWRLQGPTSDPEWTRFKSYVQQLLHARPVTASDDRFAQLHVGALTIVGDTARIRLGVGSVFRCPGETRERGSGTFETVNTVRRADGRWSPAWSTHRGHGDSEPCPRSR